MRTRAGIVLVALSLLLIAAGQQASASLPVFPTVQFSWSASNPSEYVYTVTCPVDSTFDFGFFQVDTWMSWKSTWRVEGPFVNGVDQNWLRNFSTWSTGGNCDAGWWRAGIGQEIPAGQAWTGVFRLIVPDTVPMPGYVLTKDGAEASSHPIPLEVPGVPEPSALATLVLGSTGLAGFWARKRKR